MEYKNLCSAIYIESPKGVEHVWSLCGAGTDSVNMDGRLSMFNLVFNRHFTELINNIMQRPKEEYYFKPEPEHMEMKIPRLGLKWKSCCISKVAVNVLGS